MVVEVVERRGLPRGKRAVARDDEDVRVAHQVDRLERAVREWRAAEREVELARLDRREELRVGGGLGEPELDTGPVGQEAPHDAGKDTRAGGLVGADAQRPRLSRAERGHVGARRFEPRDDRLGVPQEELAGVGERHGSGAARTLDQRLADDPLERRDLLAHRRLRVAEPLGRATERALVRDRVERGEMPHLDPEPLIRLCDRSHENLDLP